MGGGGQPHPPTTLAGERWLGKGTAVLSRSVLFTACEKNRYGLAVGQAIPAGCFGDLGATFLGNLARGIMNANKTKQTDGLLGFITGLVRWVQVCQSRKIYLNIKMQFSVAKMKIKYV